MYALSVNKTVHWLAQQKTYKAGFLQIYLNAPDLGDDYFISE